jgi:hypothetical protein
VLLEAMANFAEGLDLLRNLIQFFIIYEPSQQLQGQLEAQHSVDTGNYDRDKQKRKDNSHEANLGNNTTKKILRTIRRTMPINNNDH